MLCSLIESCKLNDVEPYAYLNDVLSRMVDGYPINRLDELLPWVSLSETQSCWQLISNRAMLLPYARGL